MYQRLFRGAVAALAIVTALSPFSAVRAESEETSPIEFWGQLIELSSTEVPTTVVVRKDYGAGYYVMCGRAYEPDLLVGWPTADFLRS